MRSRPVAWPTSIMQIVSGGLILKIVFVAMIIYRGRPRPGKEWDAIQGVDACGQLVYKHGYPNEFTWKRLFRIYKYGGSPILSRFSNAFT